MESEKSFYKINEVCSMTGVKPYVLRFWETEFARLSPILSSTGQRLYEFQHIELIKQIKELLFVRKLTIEKAKYELETNIQVQSFSSEDTVEETISGDTQSEVEDVAEVASSEAGFDSQVMAEVYPNISAQIGFENRLAQQAPLAQVITIMASVPESGPAATQAHGRTEDELEIVCEIEARKLDFTVINDRLRNLLSSIEAIEHRHQWF